MPIKRVTETKPSPYLGEQGKQKEFLVGLQIGPYLVSLDNPGISFVAKHGDSRYGVFVFDRYEGVDAYKVPAGDLTFLWAVGHTNYNVVFNYIDENEREKHFLRLSGLSSETVDTLKSMKGTPLDFFTRAHGIRASFSRTFAEGDPKSEEAYMQGVSQQSYQPGFNLNSLLSRVISIKDIEGYVPPEEPMIVKALDEVFSEIKKQPAQDTEAPNKRGIRERMSDLYKRLFPFR